MLMWVDDQQPSTEKTVAANKLLLEKWSQNEELMEMMRKQQEIIEKQQ